LKLRLSGFQTLKKNLIEVVNSTKKHKTGFEIENIIITFLTKSYLNEEVNHTDLPHHFVFLTQPICVADSIHFNRECYERLKDYKFELILHHFTQFQIIETARKFELNSFCESRTFSSLAFLVPRHAV
jgi:hypothetical protein